MTPSPNSTRPYLVRALYEWCTDNGYTPYIAAYVDETVQVPMEYVKNNEIVLNVSMDATSSLKLGNDFIEFKARFGGKARDIMVPMERVIAIYARENGQGMAFPVPAAVPPRGEVHEIPAPPSMQSMSGQSEIDVVNSHGPKVMQLVSSHAEIPVEQGALKEDSEDEPPKPPSGTRPALKRVK
jgi:stringent starvation protein B